ncbi:zinc finger protein 277-like [Rhopilema esculentum]|uniref:zinc finger protein 277-like n=1 Tax=Rhopilema esculentum TaxID=499914 RepID=UPI0031D3BAFC|eukprot:gene107-9722_t
MAESSLIKTTYVKRKSSFSSLIECLFCPKSFISTENGAKNPVLAHLLKEHKFVIAEVQNITNFPSYMYYWKKRLAEVPITDVCAVIKSNTKDGDLGETEDFYLLTNFLPEDSALREQLKEDEIACILEEQQKERSDKSFNRRCLFCKQQFKENRNELFEHMIKKHAFNIGNPDNIVHVNELLDSLADKLKSLTCLFCNKQFQDWNTLREHMRKKNHKRIDPKDKSYDKFYLINYLEPGKDWEELQAESEEEVEKAEEDWSGWNEQVESTFSCLFCDLCYKDMGNILIHMQEEHDFDLQSVKRQMGLDFYLQVKAVNYIRRQVEKLKCPFCQLQSGSQKELNLHMDKETHCRLPDDKTIWDQPEYFFPTLENDGLLCFLDDDSIEEDEITVLDNVLPEDVPDVH